MFINEVKPKYLIIDSCFYHFATPYMMGQLLSAFPDLVVAAVSLNAFPDDLAMWFIFHGVTTYIKFTDGLEEFRYGLQCFFNGKQYVADSVQALIDNLPELPEVKLNPEKRQIEILIMLCNGNSPEDIAKCLHITRRTVDWHIEEMRNVFHVQNREQLICMAFYLDIVRKEDMCFFTRKAKKVVMPQFALIKNAAVYKSTAMKTGMRGKV